MNALVAASAATTLCTGVLAGATPAPAAPADTRQQLAAAARQLEAVIEQYDTTREHLASTMAARAALVAQMIPVHRRMDELYDQVGTYSANLYRGGGPVVAVITAGSPHAFLDQLTALDHLARTAGRQIAVLDGVRRHYAAQQRDLAALLARQSAQQADLATKRNVIESRIAQLAKIHTGLGAPTTITGFAPVRTPGAAGEAIGYALAQLGKPYVWGAAGPDSFDCSGLVMAAWRRAGVRLPHSASMQWSTVTHLARSELRPGDLVFYYPNVQHVAMYLGDDKIIQAPNSRTPVSIAPIDSAPIHGYGRPGPRTASA